MTNYTLKDLSAKDRRIYDRVIGPAKEGYKTGDTAGIEVAINAVEGRHLTNPGFLLAIIDAEPAKATVRKEVEA